MARRPSDKPKPSTDDDLSTDFLIERRYSEWQRRDVRTIIVNSRSKIATQRSINAALRHANPYDRVELVGGEYFESVSLSFPVELVASEGEDVKIVFRGQCITVAAECSCFIADIECISKSRGKADAALVVSLGTPVIRRCRFSCVQLCGQAVATLDRCEVYMSVSGVGLRVLEKGGGKLVDCRIHTHGSCCVEVDTSGELDFQSCHIYQPHRGTAIVIGATSSSYIDCPGRACRLVSFNQCKIYAADAPVVVDALRAAMGEEATPMLSSTGEKACVIITHGSEPSFTSNELSQGEIGFLLESGGKARLTANIIRQQKKCGVSVVLPTDLHGPSSATDAACAPSVVLSGGNFFDRCSVGIDIACQSTASPHLTALEWLPALPKEAAPPSGKNFSFSRDSTIRSCDQMYDQLHVLLCDFVVAHIPQSQPLRPGAPAAAAGSGGAQTDVPAGFVRLSGAGLSFLSHLLETPGPIGANRSAASSSTGKNLLALRRGESDAVRARLRTMIGSIGIEISDAKFFGCQDGGVVFRRGSRGLVKRCEFLQCTSAALRVHDHATPIVMSCTFSDNPQCAILVHAGADPIIACNEILSNATTGLLLDVASRGVVLGNTLSANGGFGVVTRRGCRSVLFGNDIRENIKGGAQFGERSLCTAVRNQFTGNFKCQLLVEHSSSPSIFMNHIASGPSDCGVMFTSCSTGYFCNNAVVNNKVDGLVVELDADPVIEDNDIAENDGNGLVVRNSGAGCIVGNRIVRNRTCNVSVSEGAYCTFRGNHVEAGHLGGVKIHDEGGGQFEKNLLTGNSVANLIVSDHHTNPMIDRNTITGCRTGPGILCTTNCGGILMRNKISDNKTCGVSIVSKGNPTFTKNSVFGETIGLVASSCGEGLITKNEFYDNSISGIVCESFGAPSVSDNDIGNNRGCGLLLCVDAMGKFFKNSVTKNEVGVQCGGISYFAAATTASETLTAFSMALVLDNTISENSICGVLLESDGNSRFESNRISRNGKYGVLGDVGVALHRRQAVLGTDASQMRPQDVGTPRVDEKPKVLRAGAAFERNLISSHAVANIAFLNHAMNEFLFVKNNVEDSQRGVLVRGNSFAGIYRGNNIHRCVEGITVEENSQGNFESNAVSSCNMCGAYVADGANPTFSSGNTFTNCGVAGIFVDIGGKGSFSGCTASLCGIGCVSACPPPTFGAARGGHTNDDDSDVQATTPLIEECTFTQNRAHGIVVLSYESIASLRSWREASTGGQQQQQQQQQASPRGMYSRHHKIEDRICPTFRRNTLTENRFCGVFHERFVFIALASSNADVSPDGSSPELSLSQTQQPGLGGVEGTPKRRGRSDQRRPLAAVSSPKGKLGVGGRGAHMGDRASLGSDALQYGEQEKENMRFMLQCAAFVGNKISRNTFGVVVSGESDPFLLGNIIEDNAFYGVVLRASARPFLVGCTISGNGLGGVYCCRFSSGIVEGCTISGNNMLCASCKSEPNAAATSAATLTAHDDRLKRLRSTVSDFSYRKSADLNKELAPVVGQGCEQLLLLLEVHEIVLSGTTEILESIIAAGRPALSVASSVLPNPYASEGGDSGNASSPSVTASVRKSDYAEGSLLVEKCNSVPVSEGAVGVFFEHGSQVELVRCVIEGHKQAGVLFSCSILGHHFLQQSNVGVTKRSALIREDSGMNVGGKTVTSPIGKGAFNTAADALSTPPPRRPLGLSSDAAASARRQAAYSVPTPGVLFTQQPLVNNAATTGAEETMLERTWMSVMDAADPDVARNLLLAPGGKTTLTAKSASAPKLDEGRKQAGAPLVRDCTFRLNVDGVRIQLFHSHAAAPVGAATSIALLKSSDSSSSAANETSLKHTTSSGGGKWGLVRQKSKQLLSRSASQSSVEVDDETSNGKSDQTGPASVPPTQASSPSRPSGASAALLQHVFDGELEVLQYAIVLQGNTFERQSGNGVYVEHVVEVHAGSVFLSKLALTQVYAQQIVALTKAKSVLRECEAGITAGGTSNYSATSTTMSLRPFSVSGGRASHARHAKLTENVFRANQASHVHVTSHYIAVTGDRLRTFLMIESTGDSSFSSTSSSIFATNNVMAVPVLRDFAQSPPPGVVLISDNKFQSAEIGLRFSGMLSSSGSRVRGNMFTGHTKAAIVVEGNRACATIGEGNTFDRNAVGVLLCHNSSKATTATSSASTEQSDAAAASQSTGPLQLLMEVASTLSSSATTPSFIWTTKIFKNVFSSNSEFGIVVHANIPSVAYFSTRAMALMTPDLKRVLSLPWWVPPVIFHNMFTEQRGCPAVGCLGSASTALITRNFFMKNTVGLLAAHANPSGGADVCAVAPDTVLSLDQNSFVSNDVGLCVVAGGSPLLVGRLNHFKSNVRAGVDFCSQQSLLAASPSSSQTALPIGTAQALKLSECAFEDHRTVAGSLLQTQSLAFGRSVLQQPIQYSYPPVTCASTTSTASAATLPQEEKHAVPLCCGFHVRAPFGATVEKSMFLSNFVGLECAVGPLVSSLTGVRRSREVSVEHCVFQTNAIGVLSYARPSGNSNFSRDAASQLSMSSAAMGPAEAVAAAEDRAARFDTLASVSVKNCLLENNTENDVVVREYGHCKFQSNLFLTGLLLEQRALGYFSRNVFVVTQHSSAVGAMPWCASVLVKNFFYQCRVGVDCATGSLAMMLTNIVYECGKGFDVHARCGAVLVGNIVTNSTDCGASARGGVFSKNEFCLSPVGLIIPSSAAGASAPAKSPRAASGSSPTDSSESASTLAAFDLVFTDNMVHSCDGDGILVGGGATIEGNQVFNNKINVNIVFQMQTASSTTSAGGGGGSVPTITHNVIFDGTSIGVLACASSVAILSSNDVFDNKVFGLCCESRSQLVAEGNQISCPHLNGAVDIAQDASCQLHRNTVRNQFSPVYQKTLASGRVKDRAVRLAQLADKVQTEVMEYHSLSSALRDVLNELLRRHDELHANAVDWTRHADGGFGDGKEKPVPVVGAKKAGGRPRAGSFESADAAIILREDGDDDDGDENASALLPRSRSAAQSRLKSAVMMVRRMSERRPSGGSSSAASLKKLTRANSSALEVEDDYSHNNHQKHHRGGVAKADHVLVHVLSPGHMSPAEYSSLGSCAGNVVAGTLRMTEKQQCTTVVTTEASAVSSVMKAQLPTVVVLVVPPHVLPDAPAGDCKQYVTSLSDSELLFRLDRSSSSRKTTNGKKMQCFILVPEDLRKFFMMKKFAFKQPPTQATSSGNASNKTKRSKSDANSSAPPAEPHGAQQQPPSRGAVMSFTRSLDDFADFHPVVYYDATSALVGLEAAARGALSHQIFDSTNLVVADPVLASGSDIAQRSGSGTARIPPTSAGLLRRSPPPRVTSPQPRPSSEPGKSLPPIATAEAKKQQTKKK